MKKTIIASLFLIASCGAMMAADAKAGAADYDKSCKRCHGADGAGNPAIAKMMKVDLRALASAEVQKISDADMKKLITDGKGKMKPVQGVTPAQVDNIIAYVRTMKK